MIGEIAHALSRLHPDEILVTFAGLLLFDAPRYAVSLVLLVLWDAATAPLVRRASFDHCPSVAVAIPAHNEEGSIESTLSSIWGTYPRLEIFVVDDGSTDETAAVVRRFMDSHEGVRLLGTGDRSGKAESQNFVLAHTRAEILVNLDADSQLGENAIWEIVQPFADPSVGSVSATLLVRNAFTSLPTVLQAYEYIQSIFVGRILLARLGLLGIASGAFAATRRSVLERTGGWDPGTAEDTDLTLQVRKLGYKVAFAPYAQCYTDVPDTWWALFRQRRRWEQGGIVRNHSRKHIDLVKPWGANARPSNTLFLLEAWFSNLIVPYLLLAYLGWILFVAPHPGLTLATLYATYVAFEFVRVLAVLYYSDDKTRDAIPLASFPLAPIYSAFLKTVQWYSLIEEILLRTSNEENYVPAKVRQATWHW